MKGKMRIVFGKLDNVLVKFEAKKTPEELVTKYTNLISKIEDKLTGLDDTDTSGIFEFLGSLVQDLKERVAEIEAA